MLGENINFNIMITYYDQGHLLESMSVDPQISNTNTNTVDIYLK